jgi:hypothetical protein
LRFAASTTSLNRFLASWTDHVGRGQSMNSTSCGVHLLGGAACLAA